VTAARDHAGADVWIRCPDLRSSVYTGGHHPEQL